MKIIISPAKSMEEYRKLPTTRGTQPKFWSEAVQLNRQLAKMGREELSKLMKISHHLADLNYDRFQVFDEKNKSSRSRPAVYLYDGDVYSGLDVYTLPKEKLDDLQHILRILSGMYGLLRPLDLIQPYRLEMGIQLATKGHQNLYDFWTEKITWELNQELSKEELFLNLASIEYSKAVDLKQLKGKVISPIFKDFKNGKLKTISFYAKKARGAMVRYLLDKDIRDREGLLGFDYMGYRYSEVETKKAEEPVFIR